MLCGCIPAYSCYYFFTKKHKLGKNMGLEANYELSYCIIGLLALTKDETHGTNS
jgi:hypothetical protein